MIYGRTITNSDRLFSKELLSLSPRHSALARLVAFDPQITRKELMKVSGYSSAQLANIFRSRVFKDEVARLQHKAEDSYLNIKQVIGPGARQALREMEKMITPGTKEYNATPPTVRAKVCFDYLDRSGVAPKVTKVLARNRHEHMTLTTEDIERLTGSNHEESQVITDAEYTEDNVKTDGED